MRSPEHCAAIAASKRGANNPMFGKRGAAHNRFKGDKVTYSGMHARLVRDFGRADSHKCTDCPAQAAEWSYKETTGFSTDPSDYSPRCHPCHKRLDKGTS